MYCDRAPQLLFLGSGPRQSARRQHGQVSTAFAVFTKVEEIS
jgi:hypothetical protein